MGANLGGGDEDVIADINITPFVDVILVVLIIFMVTATAIVKQSIQVKLPSAATGEVTETISLGITLPRDGTILLDGELVDAATLGQALEQAKASSDDVVCLIAADKDVSHGRVVWVMDLIRSKGLSNFAIQIDEATMVPPPPPQAVPAN